MFKRCEQKATRSAGGVYVPADFNTKDIPRYRTSGEELLVVLFDKGELFIYLS